MVIPQHYPKSTGDISGVFMRDYVRAVAKQCNVHVVVSREDCRPGLHPVGESLAGEKVWTFSSRLARIPKLGKFGLTYLLGKIDFPAPIDVIHSHGPVFFGYGAMLLAKRMNVPVITTVHTGPFNKLMKNWLVRRITCATLNNVDCVLPVSESLRSDIEASGIRPRRCEVHYNPVDTDTFYSGGSVREKKIVWSGRMEKYKGGLRTIRAFEKLVDVHRDWTLELIGDGPERSDIENYLVTRDLLRQRVILHGLLTKCEMASIYSKASFGVFPTEHETFGLVLAEALAAGLPIIGPDRTAPVEYIDSTNGILINPSCVNDISSALKIMISRVAKFDRESIRQVVVDRFSLNSFGQRMVGLYKELCGLRKGGN